MNALVWLDKNFEKWFISGLLILIAFLSMLQVVMRYCFSNALPWVEETVVYMNVWIGFIGCSYAMLQDSALRVDFGPLLPQGMSDAMKALGDAISVGCYIFLCYVGYRIVLDAFARGQTSPAAEIPVWILNAALLCGSALAILRWLQRLYRWATKNLDNGKTRKG